MTQTKFVPRSGRSTYTALDQGKITAGDVFSTDPQLVGSKYTVLTDTKHIFGFQNVAPVLSKKLAAAGGARRAATVNGVSAKPPAKAVSAMNQAAAIREKQPEEAAGGVGAAWETAARGIVVAVPPPAELDGADEMAELAVRDLADVSGSEVTPRLLGRMAVLSGGRSLDLNVDLVVNNARVAAQVARAFVAAGR